jgi:hypothetical protein
MNNKGQMNMVGGLIMLAITIIVGAILLLGAAQNTSTVTNTVTLSNMSFTSPAEEGTYYFTDYKAINSVVIYNATGTLVPAANYTITNNVVYNGAEATLLTVGAVNGYAEQVWNISGTAQPLSYVSDAGARSMTSMITVMMALALAVIAIGWAIKAYKE